MKSNFCIFFLLTYPIILFISCSKENTDMPPGYSTCESCDWNVFTCKVNGENWYADCESNDPLFGCDPVDCQYYPDTKWLNIVGIGGKFRITVNSTIEKTDSLLEIFTNNVFFKSDNNSSCSLYEKDVSKSSFIKVTEINIENKTIRGNFGFTAINDCLDTVRITDGDFKITYRP